MYPCIVRNSPCLRVALCTVSPSTSTIWKTWKCLGGGGEFEIKFRCPILFVTASSSSSSVDRLSSPPFCCPFLLFVVLSAYPLRHWAWRDVILIEAARRRCDPRAQEFNALPRSRRIDPKLSLPPAASPPSFSVIFVSSTPRVYSYMRT